jgi:hypothetical protein
MESESVHRALRRRFEPQPEEQNRIRDFSRRA